MSPRNSSVNTGAETTTKSTIDDLKLLVTSPNTVKEGTSSSSEYRAVVATLNQISATLESLNGLQIDQERHRQALEILAAIPPPVIPGEEGLSNVLVIFYGRVPIATGSK
jgi:hypothetical protein